MVPSATRARPHHRSLASSCRLIVFDRRGTGISDPLPPDPLPPWETYARELGAVLDEVGVERAALLAEVDAGPTGIFFAATKPERTSALILAHTTAKFVAADDYPIGLPAAVAEALVAEIDRLWGSEALAAMVAPSRVGDERFRRWFAKLNRAGASPRAAQLIPVAHGRYLAERIPRATLVELPGADPTLVWETPELVVDHIEAFLTGVRRAAAPTRILATVLFTDIVGSTERAGRLGDRRWRELLNVHDELARRVVEEFDGRLVKTTGDGILATFDGPGRAIRCAAALTDELRGIGVQIRAGLHTGEVELRDGDVGGIAVHIAARVLAAAGPGDVLTSRTVRDLVVGSEIKLHNRGAQPLKGVEGTWELFSAARP
jgi:class 3 adenylate cyclase